MGDIVNLKLTEAEAADMIKDVSDKEIKEALFDIDSSKAAGSYGYTSCFFKKACDIIGTDICLDVREFFVSGRILGEINATLIALVPKIDTPNKVYDFRPIACCNVLYKCINDLMVLCNGDTESLKVVKKSLDDFSSVSGLFHNLSKSTIFFGSISDRVKDDINIGHQFIFFLYLSSMSLKNFLKDFYGVLVVQLRGKQGLLGSLFVDLKNKEGLGLNLCINGMRKSIWEAESNNNDSHGWKELMKIRDKIKPYVMFKIGDGKSISVWHDKWCEIGPLDKYPEISQIEVPILSNKKDSVMWVCEGNKAMKYTTKAAWLTLRDNWPKVDWYHMVWYSQCSPKQAIILWMTIQRKLLTQDRMKVWEKIKAKGKQLSNYYNLDNLVLQLSASPHKNKIWQIVNKLILSSTVYHIWMERNKRTFQSLLRSDDELYGNILGNIDDMLKCLRVKKSKEVLNMANQRNLKWEKERLISVIID
ncbi:RNA-directed DNA polymerase, eukaryota, reverse transcriptase zinc-binding domain protein [Tanacetum coccineum]